MRSLVQKILPPEKWKVPVLITSGILFGILVFLFHISRASSYLSDDAKTCVNCHIMAPQYATWSHSSHREETNCNDCHVPHNNFVNHYYFKAMDGLRHATIFTLRAEPQVIFIKEAGQKVVQNNCIRCHEPLMTDSRMLNFTNSYQCAKEQRQCWECHRETPHGRVNSLSSVPNARVPLPESPVPEWMKTEPE
ncbi:MAG: cytochrome c nitrite reductase small subunit [Bacteroidales bacterium]|nr:cytochrome c nitrite reductase small subunit [Bacteroidales bacterium]